MRKSPRIGIIGDCSDWNFPGEPVELDACVKELLASLDLLIFNLEGPLCPPGRCAQGPFRSRVLRFLLKRAGKLQPTVTSTERVLNALATPAMRVACLANNHILDAGPEGVAHTLSVLSERNIAVVGAGMNASEAIQPLSLTCCNTNVRVVNYCLVGWKAAGLFVPAFGAVGSRPGAAWARRQHIRKNIEQYSGQSGVTIAVIHIGRELQPRLSDDDEQFLSSLPVDLVVAQHAHVAQPTTSANVVSTGDFIFCYPGHLPEKRPACMTIWDAGKIEVVPLEIVKGMPCPLVCA